MQVLDRLRHHHPLRRRGRRDLRRPHLPADPLRLLHRRRPTARTTSSRCASPTPTRAPPPRSTSPRSSLGTKIAVIYNNDDAYSTGIYDKLRSPRPRSWAWRSSPTTTFTDDTDTDFSVQLTDAKDAGADLVFLPIYYTPASLILHAGRHAWATSPSFFGVRRHGRHPGRRGLRHQPGRGRHAADPLQRRLPRTSAPRTSSTEYKDA